MQMLDVCVFCSSCGSSQCCILHDLQFVNAGRGSKRRPYGRGILQSRSRDCLVYPILLLRVILSFVVACVLVLRCYECVSFGSKVRPKTFRCVAMCSAVLFILGPDCSYILHGLE